MLASIWNTLLVTPIFNLLVGFYLLVGGNMGIAIILLTIVIRSLLIPVVLPSMKSMKKQQELMPELDKIKKKYKHDQKKQAEEQMKLFQQHGINPASGCLTQISMIVVLIALYNVIRQFSIDTEISHINNMLYFAFLKFSEGVSINTNFLYLDLASPDKLYILPLLAGVMQFFTSKMMTPYSKAGTSAAKKTPDKKDDLTYNMQQQMLYMMPIMTAFIAASLPSGIALYLFTTTVFSMVQQYFVSGLGGLQPWVDKIVPANK